VRTRKSLLNAPLGDFSLNFSTCRVVSFSRIKKLYSLAVASEFTVLSTGFHGAKDKTN
jgi:hypothetical protein